MICTLAVFISTPLVFGAEARAQTRVPAEFKRYWIDPAAAFARENSKTRPDYFELRTIPFPFTSFYAERLKQCVFAWDPTELGAPRLDPERPLGKSDLVAQLAGTKSGAPSKISLEQQRYLARNYVQVKFALGVLLEHGTLAPGVYTPKNVSSAVLRGQIRLAGGALMPLAELNLNEAGGFEFTEKHRTLLRHMILDWPNKDDAAELLESGVFPGPSIDLERPYGTTANYPLEMATILKDHANLQQKDGSWFMAEEPRLGYIDLHRQMLFALQVFVENAELKPGSYTWAKP